MLDKDQVEVEYARTDLCWVALRHCYYVNTNFCEEIAIHDSTVEYCMTSTIEGQYHEHKRSQDGR